MKKPTMKTEIGVWKRYDTYGLEIAPSLAGACHKFQYNNYNISIELPPKPKQKDWHDENSRITCWRYKDRKYRKDPISYSVHSVDVIAETMLSRKIRNDALKRVDASLFSKKERQQLDKLINKFESVIEDAFEYWIDILRWKSGIHTLCQFRYNRQKSAWGTYLWDLKVRRRFYTSTRMITLEYRQPLTKRVWNLAHGVLSANIAVPIWHLYIAEAHQKLRLNDIRGFIIDLAIAIETIVRRVFRKFIANNATSTFEKMVSQISIGQIVDRWSQIGFSSNKWRNLSNEKATVRQVIELRNGIMHRGENPSIDRKKATEMANGVLKFVKQCEQEIETLSR